MEKQYLYRFKTQVPRKIPDDYKIDEYGRKWVQANAENTPENISWQTEEERWYVWFQKGKKVPEESEVVVLDDVAYTIESVYRYNRLKRAIVIFK